MLEVCGWLDTCGKSLVPSTKWDAASCRWFLMNLTSGLITTNSAWTLPSAKPYKQWRNRRGAECPPPETSDWEIFADGSGKKRQGKKGKGVKIEKKKRKIVKREGWKLERESYKRGEDFFFLAFHFWKRRKFVLCLPKWEFSTGKKHFTPGKKSGKWLCPLRKVCLLRPCLQVCFKRPLLVPSWALRKSPEICTWS